MGWSALGYWLGCSPSPCPFRLPPSPPNAPTPGSVLRQARGQNNRIAEFNQAGEFVQQFGTQGTASGQFEHPDAIAADSEGHLWVGDEGNNRIEEFSKEGEYISQFGSLGSGEGQFSFRYPMGMTVDSSGNIWIADTENDRVQRLLTTDLPVSTAYSYDQAGDLTTIERDKAGAAPAIEEAYAYDGAGLRVSQTVSGSTSRLTWDLSAGLPLLLDDGKASYIYGPDGLPIEQISSKGTPTFYHHDQLGSTRMLTSASGKATGTFAYGAYGSPGGSTGTQTTPLGYTGQYTNAESGSQYLRARTYDPVTGQFLSRDPIEALTREPYAYAGDDPRNNTDRTGLTGERGEEIECWWCLPPAETWEKAAKEVQEEAEAFWDAVTGGGNDSVSSSDGPRLTKAEREYEEKHHECPLERNWHQDKKVTDRELEENGVEPHDVKQGKRTDIYKDREGNLYEKPKGGKGPGDPLGIKIRKR